MNKEIEFRGICIDTKEWVYGYYIKGSKRHCIQKSLALYPIFNIIPETIGQYTGLKDKNCKKIFEGDILLIGEQRRKVVVVFEHGQFGYLTDNNVCVSFENQKPEIIGNVYEDNLESEVN